MARHRGLALSVALLTCLATVTSVRWLSAIIVGEDDFVLPATTLRHQQQGQHQRSTQEIGLPHNTKLPSQNHGKIDGSFATGQEKGNAAGNGNVDLKSKQCRGLKNTEYNWGDVVVWGTQHKTDTEEECCQACQNHAKATDDSLECNVWVWCGEKKGCGNQYKECWLKHLLHPEAATPQEGPTIPWTSGGDTLSVAMDESVFYNVEGDRSFHTVITAQGAATHWQARVSYYWFRKIQRDCLKQETCHMGGFTRLLHSGEADELMAEVPTHVVNPLQDKDHKGYVVLNRPWAVVQWLKEVEVPERYILMSEPDHIWLKPMPNLMKGEKPASFPFFYIEPSKASNIPLVETFTGKLTRQQLESIPPIGNAPTLLSYADLRRVAQTWMNTSHAIFDDEAAHKVLEMYGFAIACFQAGIQPPDLYPKMMGQPPWTNDRPWGPHYYLLHYTYGNDYTLEGEFMPNKYGEWRFDKRTYGLKPPPRNLPPPPDKMANNMVRHLIYAINEASEMIPGWEDYSKTGEAKQFWDGKTFKNNPGMTASYFS